MWASVATVQSRLAHLVDAATLILVTFTYVMTSIILVPSSNTVHWLSTTIVGALLKLIRVRTSISVVGILQDDLILSALFVTVVVCNIVAERVFIPGSNTINGLRAAAHSTLEVAFCIWASVSIVGRRLTHRICSASLVLMFRLVMRTSAILFPIAKAINRLGATLSGALLVSIGIEASKTIVRHTGGDVVGSALLVDVVLCVILTVGVLCPVSDTIHRLAASRFCAFLFLMLVRASLSVQISFNSHNIVSAFRIVVAVLDV